MIKSFEKYPLSHGNAAKLNDAINITVYVTGSIFTNPPNLLKSCWSPRACNTEPAARNNPALYIACNTKCAKAMLNWLNPTAITIIPNC